MERRRVTDFGAGLGDCTSLRPVQPCHATGNVRRMIELRCRVAVSSGALLVGAAGPGVGAVREAAAPRGRAARAPVGSGSQVVHRIVLHTQASVL